MITLQTAENALKSFYLGVVAEQLNVGSNPFLAKVERTDADVWGKDIIKLVQVGLNGGIGVGTDDGPLPIANSNMYVQFKSALKNLYGVINISDKAMLASSNSAGSFVNLLTAEMDSLLKASKFNLARMLYGTGTGAIATVLQKPSNAESDEIYLSSVKGLAIGMAVDFIGITTGSAVLANKRIAYVDYTKKCIKLMNTSFTYSDLMGTAICMQNGVYGEITGLEGIFGNSETLYGLKRSDYPFLQPNIVRRTTGITSAFVHHACDKVYELTGGTINFILTDLKTKREFVDNLSMNRINMDYMNLEGGYKAISFNGIPIIGDRLIEDNTMYLLNSDDFALHQMCDWRWIEGDNGRILHQIPGTATYSATLVKYAELMCSKPQGQCKIKFYEA